MFNIVLVSPEMPANVGNIIRLSANTGCNLHLVRPFLFHLDDKHLKRAGLDYHEHANIKIHNTLEEALNTIGTDRNRCFAISTKGKKHLSDINFQKGDVFIFGRESAGLKDYEWSIIGIDQAVRIPMKANSRSLNISNAVAITVYEAWRQIGYTDSL
ncbi:tRNA (cytidine(34)-2'-O)-methyltransferase [Taylorella equigenitalis]|uniref:tRNA (cytidine(34)-2'-O)-methyltransferase n=1 Tax=Taylorella equigenitalis (strain MCE9) TaxID=937774 RepID=A0A654KGS1_TAYEM|nr:tRNA (cytidine(34)-2'-O)-methyltransferase [Taylorella equigenitalis]ADU91643.1 tRNA (cytosine34-2'-O-)-methyltransferase [Taylorella equigenitalis MCE9]WDU56435.1 tRNA (cytidine(34)-2'-O)-methyltransferase [Taylorella equigenitalis]